MESNDINSNNQVVPIDVDSEREKDFSERRLHDKPVKIDHIQKTFHV